jgi:uncharacterized membrane protein YccC
MFERFKADDLRGSLAPLAPFRTSQPIWAIASMIAVSEPTMGDAPRMARASLINTAVGCAVGLAVLLTGGSSEWRLPIAISVAVLVSSYLVRISNICRQAPITAAIAIASGLAQHSKVTGVEQGLRGWPRCSWAALDSAHLTQIY